MPAERFIPRLPGMPLAEGEEEEPRPLEPPPPPPPPVQPEEYYPGYKRQFVATGELAARAAERVQVAQRRMQELQSQYGLRMFWEIPHRGTWSFPVLPFVQFQFTPKEEFTRQREEAQVELDAATREFSRFSWRQNLMMSLPYFLADPESDVRTLEDVMRELPNEYLLEGDRRWLEETFGKFEYLIPDVLPEGFVGETGEVRAKLLEDILAEPKTEFKAVHNLTVEELMRSVQPITAEIPPGMNTDDIRGILTDLKFDEETQQEIFSIRATARIFRTDWQEQAAYITLIRDGLLSPEAPELTPWEFTKMLFTQPALASLEMLDKYFNILSRPLASWTIINFPRINPDSAAARLEDLFEQYKEEGMDSWEAYAEAYNNWDINWVYKMVTETLFDPTTYIGLGIATKVALKADLVAMRLFGRGVRASELAAKVTARTANTGPYLSRYVGAIERGWLELWDLPFKGLRKVIKAIPKTPTQRAISYARQAFMDTRAFLRRFTGKDLQGLTVPEIEEAMEFAIKQSMERPYEVGDLAVRVGRYVTDYDFITDTVTRDWVRLAGGEGAQLTQQVVHDVNMQFDMFFRKTLTAKEASGNILSSIGVEASEKNIGVLAKNLERHSKKIVDTALDVVKGDTAKDILSGLLRNVEDMQVRKALSPAYQFALKTGRATAWSAWAGRAVDSVTRNSILAKIDRLIVAPMANQYLLFTNYGPFNILESAMRSFLGGGELLYPRAASPVDELVRLGEGLTSLPYEFVSFQRELGRLEMAVIDPKTNKTMVFSRGKIPGITKEVRLPEKIEKLLPAGDIGIAGVGISREGAFIEIGGKRYPIRSWQDWNDMFGDIGTKQRAYYMVVKYKQLLAEMAPDQVDQIAEVFAKNKHFLDDVGSIGKADKRDLVRVLEQDATVGPDMIRKHDIPLADIERRRALRDINKTLDKCTDIYSPHKSTIRETVLDGSIWRDIDGSIDAIKESVREFNIISLRSESNALTRLVSDLADFAPANSDELLRTMGFVSDIVDGITERISEVRVMTRARAAKLAGTEADDFHKASSDLLADFLGKSQDDVGKMLDGIKVAMTRPRVLLDDLTRRIKFGADLVPGTAGDLPLVLDDEVIGRINATYFKGQDELMINTLEMTRTGVIDRSLMQDIELLIHDMASRKGLGKVSIAPKPEHRIMYERTGYTQTPMGFEKATVKPKPPLELTPVQTERLGALTDAIRLRHANAVATRDLDRQIINEAIEQTPKKKRTKEWWDWLDEKRGRDAWEPYWKQEETLFNQVEDLKLGMMDSLGVDITVPPQMPDVVGQLAPAHVAYLMGVTGDDMYKALTKVGAMTVIRPKNRFVAWVYRRANKAAVRVGKTPEEIGFSREAISDVHDQMFRAAGIDPNFAVNEPLTPAMLQLEDVRQELVRVSGTKAMPDADFVKFKRYLNGTADDLEKTGMYTDEFTNLREESMMKARTQYELDFTDYDNRNMVDAALRMVYPFWTYEWQRWFWLPRAMLRTPGAGTALGRYMEYSDQGYIPVPGTDIQFNPTRGTVFMGGFRRLMLRDYPEYYDAFPGMEMIDFISRMGFYPGIQVMLPISIVGAAVGKPEWSEVLPAWAKTGFNAARTVSPELAGKTLDHVFPDRFRDYLTMLTLGGQGYDADEIWRKRKTGVKLTEEEEKLWLRAEAKATGLKGILMEQTGLFRIRPPEYTQFRKDGQALIEDMTGVPVDVQEAIQRRYAVTGKRLSDYYKLDSLQQKILYEMDAYQRWQGVTTALYPSTWQMEDVLLRDYYEKVEQLYDDYRSVGIFDEEGKQLAIGITELTQQWVDGVIGPDQWITARAELLTQASAAVREIGKRDYPDVPKTLDERAARYEERGIPAPTYSPDQELMYMYFDIRPELAYNWESGRMEYDYDTYFAKIDAILETLSGEFSQRLLDRIQYSWNGIEKLYWSISREFLRPYRMVRSVVMEQYTDEQVQQIRRFEVARGEEREALKEIIGPEGEKLISHFQSTVREARLRLRYIDPELDAWCYFFGITDKLITAQGQEVYDGLTKRYMRPEMAR